MQKTVKGQIKKCIVYKRVCILGQESAVIIHKGPNSKQVFQAIQSLPKLLVHCYGSTEAALTNADIHG